MDYATWHVICNADGAALAPGDMVELLRVSDAWRLALSRQERGLARYIGASLLGKPKELPEGGAVRRVFLRRLTSKCHALLLVVDVNQVDGSGAGLADDGSVRGDPGVPSELHEAHG